MRDILIVSIVLIGCAAALRRPWIGVMLWTWLSIMSPHRYAWGWAHDAPLAACAAAATFIGLLVTRERESPFKSPAVVLFAVFTAWATLSWLLGFDPNGDYDRWNRMIKINLMIIVALMLLHSKLHILALAWVVTGSLAILGIKGGLFTLVSGGGYRVYGPPGSFIEDNNSFSLALVMTIPLVRFLQLQLRGVWVRWGMTASIVLLAAAVFGSQSRGALLGLCAMGLLFWWRGRSRLVGGIFLAIAAISLVAFMPDSWSDRMATIRTYEQDSSAMGRIDAWLVAWNIALSHVTGAGFDIAKPWIFATFSANPDAIPRAQHSIYFEVLGNHGFIGLFLFVALWVVAWRSAGKLRLAAVKIPQAKWCAELADMCQASLIGYAVGGAFLNLSYFDLPYNVMVLIVLTRTWVANRGWERERVTRWGARLVPGLAAGRA
ncbi:MAG: putative O-glycosylation ligase, exosortase A system-associated [Caldimonas sp.]